MLWRLISVTDSVVLKRYALTRPLPLAILHSANFSPTKNGKGSNIQSIFHSPETITLNRRRVVQSALGMLRKCLPG